MDIFIIMIIIFIFVIIISHQASNTNNHGLSKCGYHCPVHGPVDIKDWQNQSNMTDIQLIINFSHCT